MDFFQVSIDEHVAVITLDNGPVNAINAGVRAEMPEVFRSVGHNPEVRVVILTAAGNKAFCAGTDVREFGQFTGAAREAREHRWRECLDVVYHCPVPVIGAVNGPALGAGLAIVSMCDLLVVAERASFGLPEITVGALGGARHLARLLPELLVRRMLLTGQRLSAAEFSQFGAVTRLVPSDALMEAAHALARTIAALSPVAMRLAKESLNRTEGMDMHAGYRVEQTFTARLQQTADAMEARAAFLEKRAPNFTGR